MDVTQANFWAAIPNTSVAACFVSSSTLPSTISPVEVMDAILQGYKSAQNESNESNTGTSFINTVVSMRNEPVLLNENGEPYRDVVTTTRIRKNFAPESIAPYMGGIQII